MVLAQRVFVASVVLIVPLVSTAQEPSRRRMPISTAGERLLERLDAMEVTKYWLPHVKLGDNWQTGETNGKTSTGTHCSAFVAAFCYRESIYILRPPEHGQKLLANAQNAWLSRDPESPWS